MTTDDDFDRRLTSWLEATAPAREPEPLVERVLARTATTRRRPAWTIPERWIPMTSLTAPLAPVGRAPWRTIGLLALLVLALVAGAILVTGSRQPRLAPPFGPAANGQIMTVDGGDIVARDDLSGAQRTLIGGPDDDTGPWPTPDGARFSFFRTATDGAADLWIADADGSDPARIGGPFTNPDWVDWSPAGDRIIVQDSPSDRDRAFWMVAADGSGATSIDFGMPALMPMFRPPDGHRLLITAVHPTDGWGLYLVDADGSDPVRLGLRPPVDASAPYLDEPAWSPDGTRLSFQSQDVASGAPGGTSLRIHIADVDPAGTVTSERLLEDDPTSLHEFEALWVPTGDAIVYIRLKSGLGFLTYVELAPGSAAPRDLDSGPGAASVTIAPDGQSVLYVDDQGGVRHVPIHGSGAALDTGFSTDDIVSWQRRAP